ncbi:serine/threonine-protein kinase [Streptomyces cucumeris]|uniref:serine/threonine-protein kinase n=1 Tax=Streptomyces cucumeris TaxID=2962890 RepID=UPI003D72D303
MRSGEEAGGRYRLGKQPVRGGMREVWPTYDKELGRRVVLKRTVLEDGGALAFDRLRAEVRALARFGHQHVVTLYDAVRTGRRIRPTSWLVLELVRGGSLDTWPPVPPGLAARVGAQIADALAALHREGIVHCDIEPGNIVVTEGGSAKLTDFGTAHRHGDRRSITPNTAVGYTPAHAAPEAVRGRPEPVSDVFSLGATLYALVTGSPPGRGGRDPRAGAPRRSPQLPSTSPARKQACELLDPAALEVVPGIDADDPEVGYAGWDCDWSSSTRDLSVDLRFDRGRPLDGEDGTPALFRGYHAFVEPEGDGDGTCLARLVYRPYVDENGEKAVQTLHLVVAGESAPDELCATARQLTRSAAAALRPA